MKKLRAYQSPWRLYGITMIVVTAVFAVLYAGCLFGPYLYAYTDIGSDTTKQYLSKIIFDIRNIRDGSVGAYSLQYGLGRFYGSTFFNYLDVCNWLLLLFGEAHLHWGLLVSLYLKYAGLCLFSLLFFRRLFQDDRLASVCALLWTFSGYAVLWGQHYQFLSAMVSFTAVLYGLQLWLEGDKKRWLLIPLLAWMLSCGYYYFYLSCFGFVGYSVCYLIMQGTDWKTFFKKQAVLLGCMFVACGIACASIAPAVARFFSSSRMMGVKGNAQQATNVLHTGAYCVAMLARLLSNDTLGVGTPYTGPTNYYEAAILCVSVLFIFSLVLLCQSPWRRRVLILVCAACVMLVVPAVSWVLGFYAERKRWTFLLCFGEVVLIGFGLKYFFENRSREGFLKTVFVTVGIGDGIYMLLIGLVLMTQKQYGFTVDLYAVSLVLALLVLYSLFFIGCTLWNSRYAYVALAVLVAGELAAANYRAVNDRVTGEYGLVTKEDWEQSMYYDGTAEIVQWIMDRDPGVYRINKTFDSVGRNDAMVQGYNSVGLYSSTVSSELVNLYLVQNHMDHSQSSNWIWFSGYDSASNMLLGVKYVITRADEQMDEKLYRKIYSDESYSVFESIYDSGFGWLYYDQLTEADYLARTQGERDVTLTKAYYETGSENSEGESKDADGVAGFENMDLFPYYQGAQLCKGELEDTLRVQGIEDDMQLYFEAPYGPEGWTVSDVVVTMEAERDSVIQLYVKTDEMGYYSEEMSTFMECKAGRHSYCLSVGGIGNVMELRLDPSRVKQDVEISEVTLVWQAPDQMAENLKLRQENPMTDFRQEGNTFYGTITNPEQQQAMLCIPLIYNEHWVASVDGAPVQIQNINGGLVGLPLETGRHEIVLTYQDHTRQIGRIVGLAFFAAYLLGVGIWWKRKRTFETE